MKTLLARTPLESDAGVEEATAGGYATGGASAGDGYGGALAEVKLSLTGEPLMPAGLDLEEMVALIDAKNARRYGQDPFTIEIDGRVIDVSRDADFDFLVDMIVRAQTREEVARLCDGPVLAVYPGLSLVDAKTCAILRVSGWHPTEQDRKPPGLHGDAPLMLYYGIDATFVDPGAMAVAFAKTLMWHDSHDLSAMRMRYGIAQRRRRLRYALDAFLNRTYMLGFRQSDWIPELAWPDSDWFFGSVPWLDPAGRWWPSRAQLIEYWYCVHDTQLAFAGSEAETRDTAFWLQIEREKLLTEHLADWGAIHDDVRVSRLRQDTAALHEEHGAPCDARADRADRPGAEAPAQGEHRQASQASGLVRPVQWTAQG